MTELQRFYGGGSMPSHELRRKLTDRDVPQNDLGIQQLAAEGCWIAVLTLAERLEQQAIDPETRTKNLEVSLRYVLVRVTAYVRMGDHERALQMAERLGDLHDPHYVSAQTQRSFVPFSLHFLRAVLPQFAQCRNNAVCPELALSRLQELRRWCEAQKARDTAAFEAGLAPASSKYQWETRITRIQRALVSVYFDLKLYSEAITEMRSMIDEETSEAKELVLLQQLGCFCMRCGNVFVAMEAFRLIENYKLDETQLSPAVATGLKQLKDMMVSLNRAFLRASTGKYNEARDALYNVTMEFEKREGSKGATDGAAESITAATTTTSDGQKEDAAEAEDLRYIEGMQRKLYHSAHSSSFILHPFVANPNNDIDATFSVQPTLRHFEAYIRKHPKAATALDSTIYNVTLLYNLEGDEAENKVALLHGVIEAFRCGREAIPKMGK